MRITLIEPAAPGFHVYSFVKQYRLGLPLLGAILTQQGHEVRIYAESLVRWTGMMCSPPIWWASQRPRRRPLVPIATRKESGMLAYPSSWAVRM